MEADDSSSGSCKLHCHITIHTSTCNTNTMRQRSKYLQYYVINKYIHNHILILQLLFLAELVCFIPVPGTSIFPGHIGGEKHIPSYFMAFLNKRLTVDLETIS